MSSTVSKNHIWLSRLEEELQRARELEAAGKKRLGTQEKRVEQLKANNGGRAQSERLLHIMRETHKLQASHVRLLEKEIREMAGQ